ncbi:unnamed protein product [Vitrella brassicaformis CCMP3155]|uniref:Uncharacterized protein n=1 Tax=Vitrella brassicaformis (strain CCMP3155) TaxID=1169540 RepID=A0A0G4G068_VITBC|nr:unnamed protein product [Vitrella brassicaformis CCMP3155]|eukprot:CEM20912.1 unnamed protein product [Vitrella brassicaformis CCMP3155]
MASFVERWATAGRFHLGTATYGHKTPPEQSQQQKHNKKVCPVSPCEPPPYSPEPAQQQMVAPRALDEEMAAAEKGGEEICIPQVKSLGVVECPVERLLDAANVMRLDDKYLCLATNIMDQFTYRCDEHLPVTDQPPLSVVAYVSLILAHYTINADDYDYKKRDWAGWVRDRMNNNTPRRLVVGEDAAQQCPTAADLVETYSPAADGGWRVTGAGLD